MDDKDHVFARFAEDKPTPSDRRETLTIPRRGGVGGSRVVEVVHVRSGGGPSGRGQPRRLATDRAATSETARSVRPPAQRVADAAPAAQPATEPATHVMPAWQPTAHAPQIATPARGKPLAAAAGPTTRTPARRFADPFDADDTGANCMRCGYAVEPTRERQGLMTCAACG